MPRECLSDVALGQRQEGFKAEKPLHSPKVPRVF